MNPNSQTQIFDPLRQKFVQADGGALSTSSLLFQLLVELRITNYLLQESIQGRVAMDSLDNLRNDLLNELNFSRQG